MSRRSSFHRDPSTGGVYEHDEETGDSRWLDDVEEQNLPTGAIIEDNDDNEEEVEEEPVEEPVRELEMVTNPLESKTTQGRRKSRRNSYKDEKSGQHYEHDESTGQTKWLATITIPEFPQFDKMTGSSKVGLVFPDGATGEFEVPPHLTPGTVVLVDKQGELVSIVSQGTPVAQAAPQPLLAAPVAAAAAFAGAGGAGAMVVNRAPAPLEMSRAARAGPERPLYLAIDSIVVEGVQYFEKPGPEDGKHVQYFKNETEFIDFQKRPRYCCNCCCCKRPPGIAIKDSSHGDIGKMAPAHESMMRDVFGKPCERCSCRYIFQCCIKPKHMTDPSMPGAVTSTVGAVTNFIGLTTSYDSKYAVTAVLKDSHGIVKYEMRERSAGHWYIFDLCTLSFCCKCLPCCRKKTGVKGQTKKNRLFVLSSKMWSLHKFHEILERTSSVHSLHQSLPSLSPRMQSMLFAV